ncbi:MAG: DUF1800 domain-containing protein [Gammaproteobacteria bacterium]|nr:DUF1800 domain-containing protein [Gammaproteobacteria bacterium]MBU1723709.1 DUF1800 domain-containing protein [Gammaproteobacteria bacterium]MBU2004793.1 DUF1800 domain-containing protein [Gammaproteobacteria bacterium]
MTVLTFAEASHLVSRTGLGAEWQAIKNLEGRTREEAVERILKAPVSPVKPAPAMTPWYKLEPMRLTDAETRKRAWMIAQGEGKRLKGWWIEQMLATRSPFLERMTLFWHNHFTSSLQKTLQPSLLHKQNLLLRRHALGNYADFLHAIAKDPAMLVYLDGYQNVKDQPNENFARELLELFTLGRGHYHETDVKAAAKAFTGWNVDNSNGSFVNRRDLHDGSRVTFMGKTGSFNGDDIIDMLLANPRTPERVCEKVWRSFVNNGTPDAGVIKSWGQSFRASGYDIKDLMRTVLNSQQFWDVRNRGTLIKSPVEILIGTVRMIPYPRESTTELLNLCRLLGQELFDPPNVKGWQGGEHWITTQTMLIRTAYLSKLSRGNLDQRVQTGLRLPDAPNERLVDWMLPVKPLRPLPDSPGDRRLVRSLLLDPAFQVT